MKTYLETLKKVYKNSLRTKMKSIIPIIICLLFSACEQLPNTGSCSGTITNAQTGETISGAYVSISSLGSPICATDQNGFYYFEEIEEGQYTINVTANGYNSTTRTVIINPGTNNSYDVTLMPINGNDNGDNNNNGSGNDNNNGDSDSGDQGGGNNQENEDYSEAEVSTMLDNLAVELISCKRSGSDVILKYTLTNTYPYDNMGITIQNVNAFTQKTHISDNLGNQYPNEFVKISLAGNTFGWGNNIEGTLLSDIPTQCIITVRNVDSDATHMHYYIYTSIALPGGVNYSDDVILKKVKIH